MDENKYPWFKSIFHKKKKDEPVKCVYAGPEYFNRRNDPEMSKVYAGPEPKSDRDSDTETEEVYAGPEFFGNEPEPIECVYAGPEYFDPEPEKPVYAGPEFFGSDAGDGIENEASPDSGKAE